jgi:signal peptidase I
MPEPSTRWQKIWREWVKPLLLILIVMISIRSAVADWNYVPSGSMKPTILEGERIFVNKLAYDLKVPFTTWHLAEWGEPDRGEVVVFYAPDDGKRMVKRVLGLPADSIEIVENQLFVNGQRAEYGPLDPAIINQIPAEEQSYYHFAGEKIGDQTHPVMITPDRPSLRNFGPITVPDGQYFMMGDNRDNSRDSRWYGFVPRKLIVGRVSGVAISVDPDRYYLPRWHRFFRGLP